MVRGELGRHPVEVLVKQRIINFWARVALGKEGKISCSLYKIFRQMYDEGSYQSLWLKYIHQTLNQLGLGYVWDHNHLNPNALKMLTKQRVQDAACQSWHASVWDTSQCSCYKHMKLNLQLEPYLLILSQNDAINLSKFRCGNHRLPINAGRFARLERHERKCNLCQSNEIGDEAHYLFHCSHFNSARQTLINPEIVRAAQSDVTIALRKLFTTCDKSRLENTAKLCKIILDNFK